MESLGGAGQAPTISLDQEAFKLQCFKQPPAHSIKDDINNLLMRE
jgi:hypothetical protein